MLDRVSLLYCCRRNQNHVWGALMARQQASLTISSRIHNDVYLFKAERKSRSTRHYPFQHQRPNDLKYSCFTNNLEWFCWDSEAVEF